MLEKILALNLRIWDSEIFEIFEILVTYFSPALHLPSMRVRSGTQRCAGELLLRRRPLAQYSKLNVDHLRGCAKTRAGARVGASAPQLSRVGCGAVSMPMPARAMAAQLLLCVLCRSRAQALRAQVWSSGREQIPPRVQSPPRS